MKTLMVIVLASEDASPLVEAHMKFWRSPEPGRMAMVVPDGQFLRHDGDVEIHRIGVSGRYCLDMVRRVRHALHLFIESHGMTHLLLHEHDSINLSSTVRIENGLFGNVVPMAIHSPHTYTAGDPLSYANAPWTLDMQSAVDMTAKADRFCDYVESTAIDRYLSGLARLAGIPIMDHVPKGYGDHTNVYTRIGLTKLGKALAAAAVEDGATMIHGAKDPWVGDWLLGVRRNAGYAD